MIVTNTKTVQDFKEQLINLNTQLIHIEKKLSYKMNYIVCDNHQKCVNQILKQYDQLFLMH